MDKPVIFLSFSDSRNDLDYLQNEHISIRKCLQSSNNLCELVERYNLNFSTLIDVFQSVQFRDRITVFHFGGHGKNFELVLKDGSIEGHNFNKFLLEFSKLKLIFFNGCLTSNQAIELNKSGIPAVIGTTREIPDETGKEFASRFYNGLSQNLTIKQSFYQAKEAILSLFPNSAKNKDKLSDPRIPKNQDSEIIWKLYAVNEDAENWKLSDEINNPYFGLPEPKHISLPPDPYISLKSYTENESRIFWGRGYLIRDIFLRINDSSSNQILLLYGQSGVGKSSLLEAGLLPRLKMVKPVYYSKRKADSGIIQTLKDLLLEWEKDKLDLHNSLKLSEPCIIIDQVEEIFTKPIIGLRNEFEGFVEYFQNLQTYFLQNVKFIFSYRKEFHAEIESSLKKESFSISSLYILPLKRNDIIEIVEGTSFTSATKAHYKITIEKDLSEQIADDLSRDYNSSIAPILQILLTNLWKNSLVEEDGSHKFTRELYLTLHKQGLALADFINDKVNEIKEWNLEIVESGLLYDILYNHTTIQGTSKTNDIEEFLSNYSDPTIVRSIINKCEELYLLTDLKITKTQVSLSHDTLAPIIRSRFDTSIYPGQRAYRILSNIRYNKSQSDQNDTLLNLNELLFLEQGLTGTQKIDTSEVDLINRTRKDYDFKKKRKKIYTILTVCACSIILILLSINYFSGLQKRNLSAQNFLVQGVSQLENRNYNSAAVSFQSSLKFSDNWKTRNYFLEALTNKCLIERKVPVSGKILTTSHSGKFAIAFSVNNHSKIPFSINLWDLKKNKVISRHNSSDSLVKCVINEQEDTYALGFSNGNILLSKFENESSQTTCKSHGRSISSMAFSNNSKYLAYASEAGEIYIIDNVSKKEELIYKGKNSINWALCFDHKSHQLLSGGNDNKLRLFEFTNNKWSIKFANTIHDDVIGCITFSNNDKLIASGSADATIAITSNTGLLIKKMYGHLGSITSLDFNSDDKNLISGSEDGVVKVWNIEASQRIFECSVPNQQVKRVQFYNYSDFGFSTDNIYYSCLRNNNPLITTLHNNSNVTLCALALSHDNKYLVSGGIEHTISSNSETNLYIWDLFQKQMIAIPAHRDDITCLDFNTNNTVLASSSSDEWIKFWNTKDWKIKDSSNFEDEVSAIVFNSKSQLIAVGNQGNKVAINKNDTLPLSCINIYNENYKIIKTLDHIGGSGFGVATSSEDYFVTGGGDKTVRLWNTNKDSVMHNFKNHEASVWAVSISKNDSLIASGGIDGLIRIYNFKTYENIDSLKGHLGGIFYLAFSPDGKWLASAGNDYTIHLWDLTEKTQIVLRSFNTPVWMLKFSDTGNDLYACGLEPDIKIFNIKNILELMHKDKKKLIKEPNQELSF